MQHYALIKDGENFSKITTKNKTKQKGAYCTGQLYGVIFLR